MPVMKAFLVMKAPFKSAYSLPDGLIHADASVPVEGERRDVWLDRVSCCTPTAVPVPTVPLATVPTDAPPTDATELAAWTAQQAGFKEERDEFVKSEEEARSAECARSALPPTARSA